MNVHWMVHLQTVRFCSDMKFIIFVVSDEAGLNLNIGPIWSPMLINVRFFHLEFPLGQLKHKLCRGPDPLDRSSTNLIFF